MVRMICYYGWVQWNQNKLHLGSGSKCYDLKGKGK